ncbi:MAG: non-ribosomal peptide synthetase, partial [Anaerolinea sp.]|nr:non-ribosomal peptide synthetase [Anaerolinea sp.]
YAHQDLPFEKLVEELHPERNRSYSPIFNVMFAFQNAPQKALDLQNMEIEQMSLHQRISPFDLTLSIIDEVDDGLRGAVEYSTALFDESTIARMMGHYQTLLESIVTDPDQRISDLSILAEAERHQILVEWNDTRTDYPKDKCIHELFEEQVERTPDAIAVVFEDQQMTYRELNQRANQLAHYLQSLGVGPEVLVGICVERSIEMVVGVLGILKAGGAYVPMDPTYPKERIEFMVMDTHSSVLLTQSWLLEKLPKADSRLVLLDTEWEIVDKYAQENPEPKAISENVAYVIYTSGSTGKSKGVMIRHRSLVSYIFYFGLELEIGTTDKLLQFDSLSFDISAEEIFACLTRGATLCLRTDAMLDISLLIANCNKWGVTILDLPTSYWHELVKNMVREELLLPSCIRLLIIGGEKALTNRFIAWKEHATQSVFLINTYGPTEATIVSTLCNLSEKVRGSDQSPIIPIGCPIANTQIYILDSNLQPVPIGISGEIHIGGDGLARGYLHRPGLTAEKFIPDPFSVESGARMYKTGDLARYLPDGNIEFLGRIDQQVKIRGFRIELGEMETVLTRHPAVSEAVAIVREDKLGDKRLVAYFVPNSDETHLTVTELRQFMTEKLPNYMVPASFVALDALPLTPNGKVDRKALLALETPEYGRDKEYVAPQTPTEEALAKIWSELLGVEKVGANDNFFELGGHSLLAALVISRINKALQVMISLKILYNNPTINELGEEIDKVNSKKATLITTIGPVVEEELVTGIVPLLPQQIRIFKLNLPEPRHFVTWRMVETREKLNPRLLEQAVQYIIKHHDGLRSRFFSDQYGYHLFIKDVEEKSIFTLIDLSKISNNDQESSIRLIAQSIQNSINLIQGPLIQIALFNLGQSRHDRLLIILSHFVADGFSIELILEDLETAYLQLLHNESVTLPFKTTSIKYWAQRQLNYARSNELRKDIEYWLNLPIHLVPSLPTDFPEELKRGEINYFIDSLSLSETKLLLGQRPLIKKMSINNILITALVQTMNQWTGESKLLFRTSKSGRGPNFGDVDLTRTVGFLNASVPLFMELDDSAPAKDALSIIQAQLEQSPVDGTGFLVGRFLSDDLEISKKMELISEKVEIGFNFLSELDGVKLKSTLFTPIDIDLGLGIKWFPHSTKLRIVIERNKKAQLQFHWIYSGKVYHEFTIKQLASEYTRRIRLIIRYLKRRWEGAAG